MKKILWLIFLSFLFPPLALAQESKSPVVLELFTSQNCSSCPPADKILSGLAKQENIIALSCNVTYWNHLNWKDTLSKDFCTERQRAYATSMHSNRVYTPQIILNGKYQMFGSKTEAIQKTIAEEIKNNSVKTIDLELIQSELSIKLPETPVAHSFALTLMVYGKTYEKDIPSGENKGQHLSYTNPVQELISLGSWDGTGKTMTYNISKFKKDAKGFVILAQKNGRTGEIIAAGRL